VTSVILIPVKEQSKAKSRLSPLLSQEERGALAWSMFEDLIRALLPLPYPVVLATNSSKAAARAGQLGWRVIWEENQISESSSVDAASRLLTLEGVSAVLRLPADVPLARSDDIAGILSLPLKAPAAALVPSWDRTGTNALLRTPPGLFPSHFGPGSYALHMREIHESGVSFRVVESPRLAQDIDDVSDVVRFLDEAADGETYRMLMGLNIKERLANHARQGNPHLGLAGNS
jgi:2-phospho-L-lactate/phosphoenolpyruvate guanylyltransferase